MLECDLTPLRKQAFEAHVLRRQKIAINAVPDHGIDLRKSKAIQIIINDDAAIIAALTAELEQVKHELAISRRTSVPPISSLRKILETVCRFYGTPQQDVLAPRREGQICHTRHVFCYLARTMTRKSYPEIARFLAGRDHTCALNSFRNITRDRVTDESLDDDLKEMESFLFSLGFHNINSEFIHAEG